VIFFALSVFSVYEVTMSTQTMKNVVTMFEVLMTVITEVLVSP